MFRPRPAPLLTGAGTHGYLPAVPHVVHPLAARGRSGPR
jgi:hypothetical protein